MPDQNPCTPTTERSDVSAWQYVGSAPVDVTPSASGGATTGIAGASYVWKRTFSLKYKCECNGNTAEVIVPNNEEYYTFTRGISVGGGYATIFLTVGLPLPGVLGAISDALGASIDIAHWWVDPAQADGEKPEDPGPDMPANGARSKLKKAPIALCGRAIRFADGETIHWPSPGAPPPPAPDPRTPLDCPTPQPKIITSVSFGYAAGSTEDEAKEAALRDSMRSAYSAIQRAIGEYKCKGRCKLVPNENYKAPSTVLSWPTKAEYGDEKYISLAQVEWTLILTCQLPNG